MICLMYKIRNRLVKCVTLTAFVLLLSSCVSNAPKQFTLVYPVSTQSFFYPDLPLPAKYQYLGDIRGESNFPEIRQENQGFWRKLIDSIAGIAPKIEKQLLSPVNGVSLKDGSILIADAGLHAIFKIKTIDHSFSIWKNITSEQTFVNPVGLAQGPENTFLVSDASLAEVFLFDQQGKLKVRFGKGRLIRPAGVVYHPKSQQIYVVDSQAHKLEVYDLQGKWQRSIGNRGANPETVEFNHPTFLTLDQNYLYVTDTMNASIVKLDINGNFVSRFGTRGYHLGNLNRPKGIAIDSRDNLYVIESYFDFLLVFNQRGELLLPLGGTGSNPGEFYLPSGVWIDSQDRIYIADMANGRVSVFRYLETNND